jgi:hypothetical protein
LPADATMSDERTGRDPLAVSDARVRNVALLVAGCFFTELLDGTIVVTARRVSAHRSVLPWVRRPARAALRRQTAPPVRWALGTDTALGARRIRATPRWPLARPLSYGRGPWRRPGRVVRAADAARPGCVQQLSCRRYRGRQTLRDRTKSIPPSWLSSSFSCKRGQLSGSDPGAAAATTRPKWRIGWLSETLTTW